MKKTVEQERQWAIEQYLKGREPKSIYLSLGRSKAWFYKGLEHYNPDHPHGYLDRTRCPLRRPQQTAREIEEIIKVTRLSLYNQGLFFGAQALLWELEEQGIKPLPSLRTIHRILSRHHLTHRRAERYEPKGVRYPELCAKVPEGTQ